MADTAARREDIVTHEGVRAVSELLGTDDNDGLLLEVVKAVATFTTNCSEACAQQVISGISYDCKEITFIYVI